jgi:hypothetical protein
MTPLPSSRVILGIMAGVVILGSLFRPSLAGYLAIVFFGVFFLVFWLTRNQPGRVFYLAVTGTLLTAVCAAASTGEGLVIAWLGGGLIAGVMGARLSRHDIPALLAGGIFTVALAALIEWSNHVLLPIVIMGGIAGCFLAVMAVRDYRFRKQYTGEVP